MSVSAGKPATFQRLVSTSKDLLPLVSALLAAISWFGVKYTTSDRIQQQQADDHVALGDLQKEVRQLTTKSTETNAKLELFISLTLKDRK